MSKQINKKIFAILILIWVLSSCTNTNIEASSQKQDWTNTVAYDWEWNKWPRWWFASGMTDEQKSQMEEIKVIMDKKRAWEELTSEEQAKLDDFESRMTGLKDRFRKSEITTTQEAWTQVEVNSIEENTQYNQLNDEVSVSDSSETKTLTINDKCIGCDHCTRTASSNFAMDWSTHKAYVISQENMDSSSVQAAIARCPVWAIEIS